MDIGKNDDFLPDRDTQNNIYDQRSFAGTCFGIPNRYFLLLNIDLCKLPNLLYNIIFRLNGVKGLYKGMEAKLLQTVLTAALMFLTYEKIAAVIFRLMGLHYVTATQD